jgi:phage head maturation protease
MPMLTKKISADEAKSKRKDHMRATGRGDAVLKAVKAPPSWDKEARTGRFVMTTQQTDRYGDRVMTEGGDTAEFERNPVALLFHNSRTWPIGSWGNLEKILKGRPPRLEGDLILMPPEGPVAEIDQAAWMIENGGIRACSIGFVPNWDDIEMLLDEEGKWTGGLQFNKWELVECSVCPIPANPGALMKHADGDMKLARELLEDVLDNYAKTPEGLLVPRAEFEKQYRLVVEKVAPEDRSTLPVTDEEKQAAEIRSIEFEVAKVCPAIAEATAAVDGDVKAKLQVVDGKWKHAGELGEGDSVNFVVMANVKDEKRTYELLKGFGAPAAGALPQAKRVGTAWEKAPAEPASTTAAPAPETSAEDDPKGPLVIELDTSEAESAISKLIGLADTLSQKMSSIFAKKNEPQERVEPKVDTPAAPPSAEAVEAARASVVATKQRLAEKGLVT